MEFLRAIRSLFHKQKNNITKEVIDISWYRDDDGVIITEREFGSDCAECSMFCQEGTISVPCNGEEQIVHIIKKLIHMSMIKS